MWLLAAAVALSAESIDVGGVKRTYELYVPAKVMSPAPLVLAFHGHYGTGAGEARLSGLNAVADQRGFIVVYPDGINRGWNDGRPGNRDTGDDLGFTTALIAKLESAYAIDRHRIFATGMSNGGTFAQYLGCKMAGTFAAIASVAASMPAADAPTCKPARPISEMSIAGTTDPIMPFGGGQIHLLGMTTGEVLSYTQTLDFWAQRDGCADAPVTHNLPLIAPPDGTSVVQTRYELCRDGTAVVGYAVQDGGHTWPGGWPYLPPSIVGITSRQLDASRAIVNFFMGSSAKSQENFVR